MQPRPSTATIGFLFVLVILLGAIVASPSRSQSHEGHAQNHDWYQHLKIPGSDASCCSNKDCRPVRAYRDDNGNWLALLQGQWVPIPPRVILPRGMNREPFQKHLCGSVDGSFIYCFLEDEAGG